MSKKELRIISPNGHLGFAPTKEESFWISASVPQISPLTARTVAVDQKKIPAM